MTRYGDDVLRPGWQRAGQVASRNLVLRVGTVLEDPTTGFCGAVVRWENGIVVLADRHDRERAFPIGPGFWFEGKPVTLKLPPPQARSHTRSGSLAGGVPAAESLASRIFVEGKHDAQLVTKIWGADLRHVGVEIIELGGLDELAALLAEFQPTAERRVGVLADHLVPGSKESRIAAELAAEHVFITGHRFVDIWQAIQPARVGRSSWPDVPRGTDIKRGTCRALGWPAATSADVGRAWSHLLGLVRSWRDLDRDFVREVERLIDFVTTPAESD